MADLVGGSADLIDLNRQRTKPLISLRLYYILKYVECRRWALAKSANLGIVEVYKWKVRMDTYEDW